MSTKSPDSVRPKRPSPALILFLLFPALGLIAAVIVIATSSTGGGSSSPTPEPVTLAAPPAVADAPMIDFTLTSLDGETVSLSDYAGRVVFLNFWATWCVPCEKELPAFQQFQANQPPDGAVILAVNFGEGTDKITPFLNDHAVDNLTVLLDPDGSAADRYGVTGLPATFVIDERGIVRYPKYGPVTVADLQGYMLALAAEADALAAS